ncbi:hypothetical protein KUF71_003705, partial [Frankliniella fusca]
MNSSALPLPHGQEDSRRWRRTVRDTIPLSRLARYVDCAYDEERERLYAPQDGQQAAQAPALDGLLDDGPLAEEDNSEPWMLPGVRDALRRIVGDGGQVQQQQRPMGDFYPNWLNVTAAPRDSAARCSTGGATKRRHRLPEHQSSGHQAQNALQLLIQCPSQTNQMKQNAEVRLKTSFARPEDSATKGRPTGVQHPWGTWTRNTATAAEPASPQRRTDSGRRPNFQRHLPFQVDLQRPPPTLNAEVPEFFPKQDPGGLAGLSLGEHHVFGSTVGSARGPLSLSIGGGTCKTDADVFAPGFSSEAAYQEDLFPYRHGHTSRFSAHTKPPSEQQRPSALEQLGVLLVSATPLCWLTPPPPAPPPAPPPPSPPGPPPPPAASPPTQPPPAAPSPCASPGPDQAGRTSPTPAKAKAQRAGKGKAQ